MDYNGYKIVRDGKYSYFEIKHVGKGSLPIVLSGKYTHSNLAKADIDKYVDSKSVVESK